MRLALALLTAALVTPAAAAAALPAQPQIFAVATAREPVFFAESPLEHANALRIEAAGDGTVEVRQVGTENVLLVTVSPGIFNLNLPWDAVGNHRLTVTLASGGAIAATMADESALG